MSAQVVEALVPVVEALQAAGINVYVYTGRNPGRNPRRSGETWVVVERDGNVGTVQYDRIDGYGVHFAIKPSREIGSSLLVEFPGGGERTGYLTTHRNVTIDDIVDAARKATSAEFGNFATPGRKLPNHGMRHFAWAQLTLLEVAA